MDGCEPLRDNANHLKRAHASAPLADYDRCARGRCASRLVPDLQAPTPADTTALPVDTMPRAPVSPSPDQLHEPPARTASLNATHDYYAAVADARRSRGSTDIYRTPERPYPRQPFLPLPPPLLPTPTPPAPPGGRCRGPNPRGIRSCDGNPPAPRATPPTPRAVEHPHTANEHHQPD